jgi:hypothetical protein
LAGIGVAVLICSFIVFLLSVLGFCRDRLTAAASEVIG